MTRSSSLCYQALSVNYHPTTSLDFVKMYLYKVQIQHPPYLFATHHKPCLIVYSTCSFPLKYHNLIFNSLDILQTLPPHPPMYTTHLAVWICTTNWALYVFRTENSINYCGGPYEFDDIFMNHWLMLYLFLTFSSIIFLISKYNSINKNMYYIYSMWLLFNIHPQV